jgi:hypothetical protein
MMGRRAYFVGSLIHDHQNPLYATEELTCLYRSSIAYGFNEVSTSHDHGSHSTGDRLKPPPDAINMQHKKIKLNSGSSSSDHLESIRIKRLKKFENTDINGAILDRIIIKDRRKEKEKERKSEAQNMKQKQADGSSTDAPLGQSESQHSGSSSAGSRKIKLKRSHSSPSSEVRHIASLLPSHCTHTHKHKQDILDHWFSKYYLLQNPCGNVSRGSSVGIATGYGLDDLGVGIRVPEESRILTSPYRSDWL